MKRPCLNLTQALTLAGLLALGGLSGCAGLPGDFSALQPGLSSRAEVLARHGAPTRTWDEAEGAQTLEYAQQPFGVRCWMVTVGPDDKLLRLRDGLSPAERARIVPGLRPEQVSRILGTERSRVFFPLSGEDVWDWNIEPDQTGYPMRLNVHFKNGVVLRSSQSMVFPSKLAPFLD
ncbi:outer membrane protein assembly factor BamE [Roseateles koreensis]|uniref:Outer membrane protein assembly factor BamE n=1 Tax=Roseateles koreensis TaxID=2987526 RepID=A0ABT5KSQ0_9BURK|nr:outer membrane protein assembly factor BamE [Roseateles koreensis]MDC8784896.1 outer membrane protein assembly factor BamE [Roseateles koreensis]